MKKLILIFLCALGAACSADSEPEVEKVPLNKAPEAPTLSLPADNQFCVDNRLEFKWQPATDPEGDPVSYIFEISTSSNFSSLLYTASISTVSVSRELPKGENFYWRVQAKDAKGNKSEYADPRHFYTEATQTSNALPAVPALVSPTDDQITATQVELAWESTDADDDELLFDLYFGTAENPGLLKADLPDKAYVVQDLTAGKTYYWKVVARDDNNGKTIGQVWRFQVK